LKVLAREYHGRTLSILPVPGRLALLACDICAAIPFGPTVDRERVLGLMGTLPMDCAADLAAIGLVVRQAGVGTRGEPAVRRTLIEEARVVLSYVLEHSPSPALMKVYVRTVIAQPDRGPLALPRLSHMAPSLLRYLEPIGRRRRSQLAERLAL